MKSISLILLGSFIAITLPALASGPSAFAPCYDHGTSGAEPAGAPRVYEIIEPHGKIKTPYLKAVPEGRKPKGLTFRLIIEDVRFTSYKCWDRNKNLTGHDVEMMTEAAYRAGFRVIEFVPKTWADAEIGGVKVPSLLRDLINGDGDAVSAGMSMTPERESAVTMIGPIYKAGKKLMGRKDNPRLNANKLEALAQVPANGYEALRGLNVLVQASTIRADFFHRLDAAVPGLVVVGAPGTPAPAGKLLVVEADSATIEAYIDEHMRSGAYDLVMLDTGSTQTLIDEGKLNVDTQLVSGNLAADPVLGDVFGKGDGVSFKKGSALIKPFAKALAQMASSGRVDELVQKWFRDENAADLSWAR